FGDLALLEGAALDGAALGGAAFEDAALDGPDFGAAGAPARSASTSALSAATSAFSASKSSRRIRSNSATIRSAWVRKAALASSPAAWARPIAAVVSLAISSRKGFCVCIFGSERQDFAPTWSSIWVERDESEGLLL